MRPYREFWVLCQQPWETVSCLEYNQWAVGPQMRKRLLERRIYLGLYLDMLAGFNKANCFPFKRNYPVSFNCGVIKVKPCIAGK